MSETLTPRSNTTTPSRVNDVTQLSCARQGSPPGIHSNKLHHNMASTDISHIKSSLTGYGSTLASGDHGGPQHRTSASHDKPKIWSIANVVTSDSEHKHSVGGGDPLCGGLNTPSSSDYTSLMSRHPSLNGSLLGSMSPHWSTESHMKTGYALSNNSNNFPCTYGSSPTISTPGRGLGLPPSGSSSNLNKLDDLTALTGSQLSDTSPGAHLLSPRNQVLSIGNNISSTSPQSHHIVSQAPSYGFGVFGNNSFSSLSGKTILYKGISWLFF